MHVPTHGFLCGFWASNSGPHACIASTYIASHLRSRSFLLVSCGVSAVQIHTNQVFSSTTLKAISLPNIVLTITMNIIRKILQVLGTWEIHWNRDKFPKILAFLYKFKFCSSQQIACVFFHAVISQLTVFISNLCSRSQVCSSAHRTCWIDELAKCWVCCGSRAWA